MEEAEATTQAVHGQQMPLYVRLKRRRDDPPPPFLCVLRPQKRQQLVDGRQERPGLLERALIFRHVDAAPPPFNCSDPPNSIAFDQQADEELLLHTPKDMPCLSRAEEQSSGVSDSHKSDLTAEESSTAVESTTFWNFFNTPLRSDVFGPFAGVETAAPAPARLGYRDVVEEAVKSLRRFRVDRNCNDQRENVLLKNGNAAQVLDVCRDAPGAYDAQEDSGDFEYDLYAIECDSQENPPWLAAGDELYIYKQRLLELLQQDRSSVALVEVEEVDQETGIVTRSNKGMQVFLEEFGDIDDTGSDESGEIDYPSGESSDGGSRSLPRRRRESESSGSAGSRSSQSDEEDYFDDDDV